MICLTSVVSLTFPPPDSPWCRQHSARKSPAWHLCGVHQRGLQTAGRVRGVRLPQRQDLPFSCRERFHLPGHEQHLPVELTWEQHAVTTDTPEYLLCNLRLVEWRWKASSFELSVFIAGQKCSNRCLQTFNRGSDFTDWGGKLQYFSETRNTKRSVFII